MQRNQCRKPAMSLIIAADLSLEAHHYRVDEGNGVAVLLGAIAIGVLNNGFAAERNLPLAAGGEGVRDTDRP